MCKIYDAFDAFNRAHLLTDYNTYNDIDKRYEFRKETILNDKSLEDGERKGAIELLDKRLDYDKIISNEGKKRKCENCEKECLAKLYCELCIRNYLKENFSNWTSKHNGIDNLIQKCQMESIGPSKIIEWIPYNKLQNIKYLTRGGCSEIYTANWIDGHYNEWNSRELKRSEKEKVIVKRLKNVESAKISWFEEARSHLTISNKWAGIVQCYGLTQDPNGNYMLVMCHMDMDLRKYLRQNNNQLTWKERIKITVDIIDSLLRIHNENAIHRDLHSGNILYSQQNNYWVISDLGFCGPADKPLGMIYGNLPYIDPEVILGKECTKASDIYSIGMLMWEISSGQPPFINYEHNYDLAVNIINGKRPTIVSNTPSEYEELIKQCWIANPTERPDINKLWNKIIEINKSYHQDENNNNSQSQLDINYNTNFSSMNLPISNFYNFGNNLPEPRNASKEYHSIQDYLIIPDSKC